MKRLYKICGLLSILLGTPQSMNAQHIMEALDAPLIPDGVVIDGGDKKILSVYDIDYWPYTQPTAVANWNTTAADGSNENRAVDYQGKITTNGFTVTLPITVAYNTVLPAFVSKVVIPANHTEDGISRTLEFSWETQPLTTSTTSITATIKSLGGDLLIKKLDVNSGNGNDNQGVELATFSYQKDNTEVNFSTYQIRVMAGVPDKMFDQQLTIDGNIGYYYSSLYIPITGNDGKTWLNNNLGADYTNMDTPYFEPFQSAKHRLDKKAYGYYYWGNVTGKEQFVHDDINPPMQKYPSLSWDYANGFLFTYCPSGFRMPTFAELFNNTAIRPAAGHMGFEGLYGSHTGLRMYNLTADYLTIGGHWDFEVGWEMGYASNPVVGTPIRCIAE